MMCYITLILVLLNVALLFSVLKQMHRQRQRTTAMMSLLKVRDVQDRHE